MDISNGSGGIDSSKLMDYFTKDFLTDLGKMAALRDELEKRQGSINAVNAANTKVVEADAYAESTKAQVDALLADAKIKNTDANARQAILNAREKDLAELEKQSISNASAAAKDVAAKETSLVARENGLAQAQAELRTAQDTLTTDRINLDARIKALQDKVASINI